MESKQIFLASLKQIHLVASVTIAFVWVYHGLVPKLLGPHPQELAMLSAADFEVKFATYVSYGVGIFEILWGVFVVMFRNHLWPFYLTIVAMVILTLLSISVQPSLALFAFNPVTVNIAVIALSVIVIMLLKSQVHR